MNLKTNSLVVAAQKSAKVLASSAVGLAVIARNANAALDVAGVTTAIGEAAAAVALVGAAYLLVKVGIKAFKWVASAI